LASDLGARERWESSRWMDAVGFVREVPGSWRGARSCTVRTTFEGYMLTTLFHSTKPPAMSTPLVAILKNVESSLLKPTALADTLPDASDLAFERTLSRPLARQLDAESARILALVGKVLAWTEGGNGKELDGEMIREGVYSDVIERVEKLLEGADDSIEKHLGVGKHKAGVGALGAKLDRPIKEAKKPLPAHLLLADIPKPQLLFPPRLVHPRPLVTETDPSTPFWKPLLRTKPHALDSTKSKSRKDFLVTEVYTPTVKDPNAPLRPPRVRYAHPYADEYDVLSPPESYFIAPSVPLPISPTSFTDVPFEWVNTPELLKKMLDEIREVGLAGEKELAVDLEHHDLRSWTGICCLLQLSTRRKDYVVDVLDPAVRDALEGLNEFFANPTWIKVGSHSSVSIE
jgi:exosome complex exonuclease RRP6